MGVKVSPDILLQYITKIVQGLLRKNVIMYIDNCGIWSKNNRIKYNLLNCDWAIKETDFL